MPEFNPSQLFRDNCFRCLDWCIFEIELADTGAASAFCTHCGARTVHAKDAASFACYVQLMRTIAAHLERQHPELASLRKRGDFVRLRQPLAATPGRWQFAPPATGN